MPKKFLTVSEVAKLMGVTPLTVRNWDKKSKLTAHRNPMNNYRMYKIEDIENLIQEINRKEDAAHSSPFMKQKDVNKIKKLKVKSL